jgi:hypothetical protein
MITIIGVSSNENSDLITLSRCQRYESKLGLLMCRHTNRDKNSIQYTVHSQDINSTRNKSTGYKHMHTVSLVIINVCHILSCMPRLQ